ncbi:hypothetical protein MTO92_07410 [Lentilactobacillus kefiri]|uniref:hypothetical protein n=1 Tax=Lentilactobacillus kefiri TaxID=33962 RepID=UPI001FB44C2A|nr:hypothetical protein [Lentilactobacillus kefiri]UOD77505.1 hypothetical protein MTO92_07410 [Lentilactobacillus kefiri]
MKFIVYNVRDDEIPFIEKWGKDHKIEVKYTTTTLTQETVQEAAGFDGVSCLQTIPYSKELFDAFKKMGIKYLSLRNVGVDNVDLAAAKGNGVQITNVPAYSPESIAGPLSFKKSWVYETTVGSKSPVPFFTKLYGSVDQ